jgi:hypothetical protein
MGRVRSAFIFAARRVRGVEGRWEEEEAIKGRDKDGGGDWGALLTDLTIPIALERNRAGLCRRRPNYPMEGELKYFLKLLIDRALTITGCKRGPTTVGVVWV